MKINQSTHSFINPSIYPSINQLINQIINQLNHSFTALTFISLDVSEAASNDGLNLNYTLPMLKECKEIKLPNGSMVQTIPKLALSPGVAAFLDGKGLPCSGTEQRVCKYPGN